VAIHFSQVDRTRRFGCNHPDGPLHADGNAEILSEVIHGTEREDPKGGTAFGEDARDGLNTAVSTADYDGVELSIQDLLQRSLGSGRQACSRQEFQVGRDSVLLERGGQDAAQ